MEWSLAPTHSKGTKSSFGSKMVMKMQIKIENYLDKRDLAYLISLVDYEIQLTYGNIERTNLKWKEIEKLMKKYTDLIKLKERLEIIWLELK